MTLTKEEIHEMHMALAEVLEFFKKSKRHQKIHKKEICDICKGYEELRLKLVKKCECIENPIFTAVTN